MPSLWPEEKVHFISPPWKTVTQNKSLLLRRQLQQQRQLQLVRAASVLQEGSALHQPAVQYALKGKYLM